MPNLVTAYGNRVLEITVVAEDDISYTLPCGLFNSHVSIDGAGIWSAAISPIRAVSGIRLFMLFVRESRPSFYKKFHG